MPQHNSTKDSQNQVHPRKGDVDGIKIGWGKDDGQEVIIRRLKPASRRKAGSAFSWFQEFTVAWSETFISKSR